ncbi:MAG TPA: PQQ-binding-like beta-propeller repeat protein [Bryobacteraceae bacterium]|nr:PQQ-binding-like beta-propeller repeat protein [Bryobacteraceae bacterium]
MRQLVALFVCMVNLTAEEWTRFRGPNGSGVSKDKGFPVEFGKDRNLAWRTVVRPGKSSPVLTPSRIFLTASDGGKLYTQCFDRGTGKLLWERSIDRPHSEIANRLNHEAAITPVSDGDSIYAFFKDFGFVSYDSSGRLRWKTPLGPFMNTQGLSSSPILAGDSVILVADQWEGSYIAALDRKSGEMRWKVAREETEAWGTPLIHQFGSAKPRIITTSRGQFGVHAADTGKREFTLQGLPTAIVASPVLEGDTVYGFGYGVETPAPFAPRLERHDKNKDAVLTPDEFGDDPILNNLSKNAGNRDGVVSQDEWDLFAKRVIGPNCLIAIQMEKDGARELWRYEKNFTSVIPSTLAYQDILYIVRNGGIMTTHDAGTGKVTKSARIAGALGGYSSSPVAADGKVWLSSEEGKVVVLRAGSNWEVLAVNDLGEEIYATPALSDGVIYLRTEEALYAFALAPSGKHQAR